MDAEHRHELKTNELADWLGHLPEFCKKNSNYIFGIAIICVALITAPMFTKMKTQKEIAEQTEMTQSIQLLQKDVYEVLNVPADDPLAHTEALNAMLTNADALLDKAAEADNPNLAAMARIKAAQAYRTQLHLRKVVDTETVETQIQKAKDAYQKAFETAETATLKAMAQLGLGLCSEELGQTAQAAEIYQQIIDDESYAATVLPAQAQKRLDGLEENAEVFNFAEPPAVVVEESIESTPETASPAAPAANESAPEEAAAPAIEEDVTEAPVAEETAEAVDTTEETPTAPAVEEATEAPVVEEKTETAETTEETPAATE